MQNNNFETFPGASHEVSAERAVPPKQDFAESFSKGVPEFSGNKFAAAHEGNSYYGETINDEAEAEEYNDGVANAATLINYGLDAVAREKGVEAVVQGIKSFDASGSDNPLRDLYNHLGIDTKQEFEDVRDESMASKAKKMQFRTEFNMPKTQQKSREGMLKAIADMKELIGEVETADPRYEELRRSARASGKGYFEYAVKDFGLRGLTDLFSVLAEQKKKKEAEEKKEETRPLEEPKRDESQPKEEEQKEPQLEEETNPKKPQPDVEGEENTLPEEPQVEAEQPKTPKNSEEPKPNPDNPGDYYEKHPERTMFKPEALGENEK